MPAWAVTSVNSMGPEGRGGIAGVGEVGSAAGLGVGDCVEEGVGAEGSGCDNVAAGFWLQLADSSEARSSRQQVTLRFSIKSKLPFVDAIRCRLRAARIVNQARAGVAAGRRESSHISTSIAAGPTMKSA